MSTNVQTTWSNPTACPFCDAEIADPGAGFVDHIADSPDCDDGFDAWKENVAGDVAGGWSG